jgi:putative DNA primase/helicase
LERDRQEEVVDTNGPTSSPINLAAKRYESVLEAARGYTRGGVRVTPLCGKRPILYEWPSRLLDEEELASHFDDHKNVGVLLGEPSRGLVDVDLDVGSAVVIADLLLPEKTLTYGRKNNPRSHRLFDCGSHPPDSRPYSLPKSVVNALGLGSKDTVMLVELRSTGKQSVLPPSIHPQDGDEYVWDSQGRGGSNPLKIDAQELEEAVREVASATLLSLCCQQGTRQEFFLAAAGFLGRYMDHERVEAILEAVGVAAGDEEPEKRAGAVRDTLKKLREEGHNVTGGPKLEELAPGVPGLLIKWWGWSRPGQRRRKEQQQKTPTHDELRDRWLERYPKSAYGLGSYRRYKNGIWVPLADLAVEREISAILEEAKPEGTRPTASLLTSVEKLSRVKVAVEDSEWDAKENVLVCSNGTLEVFTKTLRDHDPEDYPLTSVPYAYNPTATAPWWDYFLATTVPEAAGFLQEFAGYALTVDTSHELAVWLYGPPGAGKSTFIEGLKAMLGERAGVLGLADVQRNRFALANLPGKTLLVATEQPSDYIASTHLLNAIVSGEEIAVERKFKDPFYVTPRGKICWAMNDLPRVGDANSGLFRRVKVVPFPKLEKEPERDLKDKIKAEGAGILNWAGEAQGAGRVLHTDLCRGCDGRLSKDQRHPGVVRQGGLHPLRGGSGPERRPVQGLRPLVRG